MYETNQNARPEGRRLTVSPLKMTERAMLVHFTKKVVEKGATAPRDEAKKVWLPVSQINPKPIGERLYRVEVPEWLMAANGLRDFTPVLPL